MNKKIMFVDIDGPLATNGCSDVTEKTKWHPHLYRMDIRCVKALNEILTITGAEMVISSDWRIHFTLEELGEIFEWNGVIKKPTDKTIIAPVSMSSLERNRVNEISIWLKEHLPDKWVAFDDLNLYSSAVPNFVLCDYEDGISNKEVKETIIKYLIDNE
jgi:hypothetical protein